tara:strand:- start:468 stop:698 length:231 start_codon:yes stop_codon:yes gene_type:complete
MAEKKFKRRRTDKKVLTGPPKDRRKAKPPKPKKDIFGNVISEGPLDKLSDIINEPFLRRARGGLIKGRPKLAKKGF